VKIAKASAVGLTLVSLLLCLWIMASYVDGFYLYYATNDKQSLFIQKYDPDQVLKTFVTPEGVNRGTMSESAGRKFVPSVRTAERRFVIQPGKAARLMNALNGDMSAQLLQNGAQILSQTGNPSSGFHFTYRIGKTIGSATISPLITTEGQYRTLEDGTRVQIPPPNGAQDMAANIVIEEKWFPKESTAQLANR